jgi:1-acyl-sn-glycerol-3-phosphate acyltransferase
MFGREINLPIDIAFGLQQKKKEPQTKYVERLRNKLLEAYRLAAKQNSQSQEKQKNRYDLRTRGSVLEIGDSVLVKKVAFDGNTN